MSLNRLLQVKNIMIVVGFPGEAYISLCIMVIMRSYFLEICLGFRNTMSLLKVSSSLLQKSCLKFLDCLIIIT